MLTDLKGPNGKYNLHYNGVRGVFLGPSQGTTPATVPILKPRSQHLTFFFGSSFLLTRKTYPCNVYPLEPHFYKENWGMQRYTNFTYFCYKT